MSLISAPIPNFINGVSQQPFTLRLSSQGDRQENGLSTISAGLLKRPPTEHLKKLGTFPLTDSFVHMVNRDATEKYIVMVNNGTIRVFDLNGVEKVVNIPPESTYLLTELPASVSFAVTTVADYTFIVNRTVVVQASLTNAPIRPKEGMVNVKGGSYARKYQVLLNGVVAASFDTPDGLSAGSGTPKQIEQVATDYIAQQLQASLTANGFNTGPWTSEIFGSVVVITRSDGVDFTLSCEDGAGGVNLVAIKSKLQKFTDLPPNPRKHGFTVEIVGDQASDFDNYWVRFDGDGDASNATGVWRETVAPGTPLGFNPLTMPHQLVRESDGTFTFAPVVWADRKVGDILSSPNPSIVGRRINDVFFFQNRLGFLSDENYIQSETGEYFNLFRTTVTALLDSDPVDVNAATNKIAILEHAIPFNRDLLLFSTQQQFLVSSGELMTPKGVPLKPTTEFAVSTKAKPVAAGRNVYFATDKGAWSAVREFFAQDTGSSNDAIEVTSHVPRYIPSGIVKIASGASEDVLALLSELDRSKLYIYRYYFSDAEKLQSSWSVFTFGTGTSILSCDFVESTLYLVVSRIDGIFLERMDLSLGAGVPGEPYLVHLDRKLTIPTSALSFDGINTVIAPGTIEYTATGSDYMVVAHGGGTIKPGQLASVVIDGGLKVKGNFTASPLSFGLKYLFRYTLSKLVLRSNAPGGGVRAETGGRTQVRTISFGYSETGFFQAKVTPEARQTYTYTFSGKVLGSSSSEIGGVVLPSGSWSVPVQSRNSTVDISLESDMPLPVSLLSAEWEGFFVKRSQSV